MDQEDDELEDDEESEDDDEEEDEDVDVLFRLSGSSFSVQLLQSASKFNAHGTPLKENQCYPSPGTAPRSTRKQGHFEVAHTRKCHTERHAGPIIQA